MLKSNPIPVLDHGYVQLITTWGSDEQIIESARMSTGKGFLGWEDEIKTHRNEDGVLLADIRKGDKHLLKYLYTHKHLTPFEMCGAIFEVKAPIFVFREWHRHRTQSYNEMSARYIPIPNENYVPDHERIMSTSSTNKQAQGSKEVSNYGAVKFRQDLIQQYKEAENLYQSALFEGVPKELARLILPVGRYSKMRASANLRNWFQFLELRTAPNAQWEIQEYARAVQELLTPVFPRSMELFNERA